MHYENIASVQKETEARGLTMDQISTQFHYVFNGEGRLEKKLHLEIDSTVEPVRQHVRRLPVSMKPKLKEELARLLKIGVIKPLDTPTDWVSRLVVIKEPNGKLRVCIDPKPLNKASKHSHYPPPVIEYFQHHLDQAIEGFSGVRMVADDILITGEGDTLQYAIKDNDKKLLALLARCRDKGV